MWASGRWNAHYSPIIRRMPAMDIIANAIDTVTRQIPLTKGFVATVDASDYDWLNQWKWCTTINKTGKAYATRAIRKADGTKTMVAMHRLIAQAPKGTLVDHRNKCTTDNRRENLRLCGHEGNSRNRDKFANKSSQYKGVSFNKKAGKWKGSIFANKRYIHLGMFFDEAEAARAYDKAALDLHGEFASLNFS